MSTGSSPIVGGLSVAQVALNISASTISIHLSSLEERLGMRLCERGPGGFALTEQGRQVYAAATKLSRSLEDFRAEVGALRALQTVESRGRPSSR